MIRVRVMGAVRTTGLLAALLGAGVAPLRAQGSLSTQGLGFPQGQLSTQSMSVGGATGESDPFSPLNPAAISLFPSPTVFMQVEPEYRVTRLGGASQSSSVSRFPLFLGALLFGQRWTAALSASTLLDRTWETTTRDTQFTGPDTLAGTLTRRSDGSIADVRLAVAYQARPWLRVGVGGHGISGRILLQNSRTFDDTARFLPDTQRTSVGFAGNALSLGVEAAWPRKVAVGASLRHGGTLHAYSGNDVVGTGSAPDHYGVSVLYLGITGTTLSLRAAKDSWSRLRGVAPGLNVHEGLDLGIGAETTGPRLGSSPLTVRAGFRARTLPFSVNATAVKDRSVSGGFALPFASSRVQLNMGLIRSARTGGGLGASESAWTLSTGMSIRP